MSGSPLHRRLTRAGAVVLVAGLVLGPALWVAGAVARVDPAAPLQTAGLLDIRVKNLCPTLGPTPPCSSYYPTTTSIGFVPSGNDFVYSFTSGHNGSGIAVVAGTNLHLVAETGVPCIAAPPIFVVPGPYSFLVCERYDNQSGWSDSLLAFNWTNGSVAAMIPVPFAWPQNFSVAYEAPRAELFVALSPGIGEPDRLLTLSLPSFHLLQNTAIPFESGPPFLWTWGSDDQLALAFVGNSSLLTFDPSTSTWSRGPDLGSPVREATLDIPTGRAYLLVGSYSSSSNSFRILDLQPKTLGVLSATTIPTGSDFHWFLADETHGDLYVLWSGGVDGLNESDGHLIGSWLYWDSLTFSPTGGGFAYSPSQDMMILPGEFQEAPNSPIEPGVSVMNLTHGSSPQASYTGTPLVGSSFPLLVFLVGFVGGVGLLVAGAVLRSRAPDDSDSPTDASGYH